MVSRFRIADDVEIKILAVVGSKVRLGISAPGDVPIHREEVFLRLEQEAAMNHAAARGLAGMDTTCELSMVATS